MKIRTTYKILLLAAVTLAVYYPSIWGPYSSIDDPFIVNAYGSNGVWSFFDVIKPGRGFYYRPLVDLSYYIDARLWDLDPKFMHLENVLLHTINTVLIYILALRFSPDTNGDSSVPLFSALLFALHPINTESVNWIAARTDPMSTLFVLLSLLTFSASLKRTSIGLFGLSAMLTLMAGLCKEVAFLTGFVMLFMFLWWKRQADDESMVVSKTALRFMIGTVFLVTIFFGTLVIFFLSRGGDNSVSMIFRFHGVTPENALVDAISAFGFYCRKFLFPLPLNFAINELPHVYLWTGLALLPVSAWVLFRVQKRRFYLFTAAGLLYLLPPLAIAVVKIAWTPLAERYLYLPTAFFSLAAVEGIKNSGWTLKRKFPLATVVMFVLYCAAVIVFSRNLLWQDRLSLYEDTVHKSPRFGNMRNELAVEYMKLHRFTDADYHLAIAASLPNRAEVQKIIELNRVAINLQGKSQEEFHRKLLEIMGDFATAKPELLHVLNEFNEARLPKAVTQAERNEIFNEILVTNKYLYLKQHDPFILYRSGQLSLFLGKRQQAAEFFAKAAESAPASATYKDAAARLHKKLTGQ